MAIGIVDKASAQSGMVCIFLIRYKPWTELRDRKVHGAFESLYWSFQAFGSVGTFFQVDSTECIQTRDTVLRRDPGSVTARLPDRKTTPRGTRSSFRNSGANIPCIRNLVRTRYNLILCPVYPYHGLGTQVTRITHVTRITYVTRNPIILHTLEYTSTTPSLQVSSAYCYGSSYRFLSISTF